MDSKLRNSSQKTCRKMCMILPVPILIKIKPQIIVRSRKWYDINNKMTQTKKMLSCQWWNRALSLLPVKKVMIFLRFCWRRTAELDCRNSELWIETENKLYYWWFTALICRYVYIIHMLCPWWDRAFYCPQKTSSEEIYTFLMAKYSRFASSKL